MTSAFCTRCGAALNGSRFCTTCGAAVPEDVAMVREVPPVAAALPEDTIEALDRGDTDLVPRRAYPISYPPPLPTLPPVMPVLAPKPKKSPWPWIAVAAALVVGAGVGTTIVLWPHQATGSGPVIAPSISPSVSPLAAPTSPTAPTLAQSSGPTSIASDESTAASLVMLLNDDLVHHKAFTDAYIDLKNHCGPNAPTLVDYDNARLERDLSVVENFAALRTSYAARANTIATTASAAGAHFARTFAGLQPDLSAAAKAGVDWSDGVSIGTAACAADTPGPALTASDNLNSRRSAWMSEFRTWVPGGDATLGSTYKWFLGAEAKTAI